LEGEAGDGQARAADGVNGQLRLAGRDALVRQALEDDQGAVEVVDVRQGGALDVEVLRLRPGADQRVEVARLELVGVLDEGDQVAEPEMVGAGPEVVARGQRGQGRVAPGAATRDGDAAGVGQALRDEVAGDVDAVVDIDHTPGAVEAAPVLGPIPGRAAVVHVDDPPAAAGPELGQEVEHRGV